MTFGRQEVVHRVLHFPNNFGDLPDKDFKRALTDVLLQFWSNEREGVRHLPGGNGIGDLGVLLQYDAAGHLLAEDGGQTKGRKPPAKASAAAGGGRGLPPPSSAASKKGAAAQGAKAVPPPGYDVRGQKLLSEADFKSHNDLPLARIKRIMKSDEDVRMISAEAPIVFAKACELFILELTVRSYVWSERRNGEQVNAQVAQDLGIPIERCRRAPAAGDGGRVVVDASKLGLDRDALALAQAQAADKIALAGGGGFRKEDVQNCIRQTPVYDFLAGCLL